jgi:hypothetical protein
MSHAVHTSLQNMVGLISPFYHHVTNLLKG